MSLTEIPAKADCYAAGERGAMVWWQALRAWLLGPLLGVLTRCGITADHITLASLGSGLAFVPLWLSASGPTWSKTAALGAMLVHVLLDGLDGPLARHQGVASRRGSFTDTLVDQIVVTASTLALMATPQLLNLWVGGWYLFVYAMVVAFAMVRNALGVPYSWLVRPRFWVYAWIVVELWFSPEWMDFVVGGFAIVLSMKMASGFIAIRRML